MNPVAAGTAGAAGCTLRAGSGPGRYELAGSLTLQTVAALRAAGRSAFAAQPGAVSVSLAGVTRAESAGLALLVDWLAWAAAAGRALRYEALPDALVSLAHLAGVDELLAGGTSAGNAAA